MLWLGITLCICGVAMRGLSYGLSVASYNSFHEHYGDALTAASPDFGNAANLGPDEFDRFLRSQRDLVRVLAPPVRGLVMWRIGLSNWGNAFLVIGVIIVIRAVFAT